MMDTTEQEQNNVTEENTAGAGGGTGPPAPEPRRLTRSTDDVVIAGVASGLAKHLNLDPLLVRIGFAVATLAGGLGFLLYLVGWVLIPEEGSDRALGYSHQNPLRAIPPWILASVVGIAGLILISEIEFWDGGAFFWALLLIGGGILLYRMDTRPPRPASPPTPATTPPLSSPAEGGGPSSTQPLPVVTEAPRPKPRKERSYLGRYTFAAILLVLGITAMLDVAGAFTLEAGQYPALALIVLGGGLLVGTILGRARGLIVLGILFVLPIALGASLINVPIEGGAGERSYTPVSAVELDREFHLVAGKMVFHLDGLEWSRTVPVEITATAVAGQIQIFVPRGVTVSLNGRVSAGQVELFGLTQNGYEAEIVTTDTASPGSPVLVIDAEVSFGNIEIIRSSSTAKGTR